MMKQFATDFNVKVGLSDHTLGSTVPIMSVAMGATVIEKHFILDRNIGGPDASFSMDEKEFTSMVTAVREAEKAIGNISYTLTEKQLSGKAFSRSLYAVAEIKKGDLITEKNIKSVRPGFGLHPKYYNQILNTKAVKDFEKGDRLTLE